MGFPFPSARFRHTDNLAIELLEQCDRITLKGEIKSQMARASLSVVLNLAEGSAKHSRKERARFYQIALGSLREVQAILHIKKQDGKLADQIGANLFRLIKNPGPDL